MLSIENIPRNKNIASAPIDSVKNILGVEASHYITDDRINLMLMMTQGNIRDAVQMALGYIIQHLDLMSRSNPALKLKYIGEMNHYRKVLQDYIATNR